MVFVVRSQVDSQPSLLSSRPDMLTHVTDGIPLITRGSINKNSNQQPILNAFKPNADVKADISAPMCSAPDNIFYIVLYSEVFVFLF